MSDRSSLSTAEIDAIFKATAKERLINGRNRVIALNRIDLPFLRWIKGRQRNQMPVRGDYIAQVKGERGQDFQSWSGTDVLNYEDAETIFELIFGSGKVHLGGQFVHDALEQAGVPVNYEEAARGQLRAIKDIERNSVEVIYNLANEKFEDIENNFMQNLEKDILRSNASDPKKWTGIDGLFPVTSNSTGAIGGKDRSNPDLRHVLKTSVAEADLEFEIDDLLHLANKRNGQDGSRINRLFAGRAVINDLKQHLRLGSSTITPIVQRRTDSAQADRLAVGVSDDAFFVVNAQTAIEHVPNFEQLDEEDAPAIPWTKRLFGFNDMHLQLWATPGQDGLQVVKPTPYNQQITYVSMYGQYGVTTDKPNSQGVLYLD